MALEVTKLKAGYGKKIVLTDVSLHVGDGEVVAMIGANGAGKSTTLNTIFGLIHPRAGNISYNGKEIGGRRPGLNVLDGMTLTPQGGRVFPNLAVYHNLLMGGYRIRQRGEMETRMDNVFELFPVLKDRFNQRAGTLSGGERQMLAIGMSLMMRPRVMFIDEPSTGLAPYLVTEMLHHLKQVNKEMGTSLLVVEQTRQIMTIADRVYVMKLGRITGEGKPEKFMDEVELRKAYLADVERGSNLE